MRLAVEPSAPLGLCRASSGIFPSSSSCCRDAVGLGTEVLLQVGRARACWPHWSKEQKSFFYRWYSATGTLILVFSSVTYSSHCISPYIFYFKVTEEAGISLLPSHRGQLLNTGGNGILISLLLSTLIPAISKGWHFSKSRLQNSNEMISTMSGQS